ncbi:MAG: TetR/AcrR family transcriptional regulator [Eubacteriales bacterium]|nr:TetR/AcrR family transcriptional regulator [Eubacteriales bacterium]
MKKKRTVRLTKRQLQAMETKNRIYQAAVREINEKGFNHVNIEDITREAKVAKGTFYTHFESKEAIIAYTFEQSDKIYEKAIQWVEGKSFLYMATYFVRFCYTEYEKRGKGIVKAMISNYFNFPGKNFYSRDRMLYQCLMKIVEDGKKQQVLDASLPTEYYADILLSTMVGVEAMWCFDEQGRSLVDMIEDIIRITALGLMK